MLSVASDVTATVIKTPTITLAATATGVANVLKLVGKIIVATATSYVESMAGIPATASVLIAVTTSGAVSIVKDVTKMFVLTSSTSASLTKRIYRTFTLPATGTASVLRNFISHGRAVVRDIARWGLRVSNSKVGDVSTGDRAKGGASVGDQAVGGVSIGNRSKGDVNVDDS